MPAPDDDTARAALAAQLEQELPGLEVYVRLNMAQDLRARESSADLVQSVCRELVTELPGFDYRGPEALRAWLFRTAIHKIRDRAKYHRADRRNPERERDGRDQSELQQLYASVGTPSAHAIAHENAALVEAAFAQLSPEDREVVTLCRVLGRSSDEAAAVLGKSAGAVRTQLCRALARLAAELDRLGVSV
ncbi:MAG: sigma-70 family RNA polymerase sigma factor [Planctomycetes bacterium]|nr:sigma-70 family RNA polymerase sigma factor [Planctomycetota bacterium]